MNQVNPGSKTAVLRSIIAILAVFFSAAVFGDDVCVTPEGGGSILLCVNEQVTVDWSASYCGPAINGTTECDVEGPDITWQPSQSTQIGPYGSPGDKGDVSGPTATATFSYTPKENNTTGNCPADVVVNGSGKIHVVVKGLVQFNAKSDRFPKCRGDTISRDDFVILTSPTGYESEVEVYIPGTNPSQTSGKATMIATATMCGETKYAVYTVLADETTESCEGHGPISVSQSFSGVSVETNVRGEEGVVNYDEVIRDGTITGSSSPTMQGETQWSPCGGSCSTTEAITWTISGSFGLTFAEWKKIVGGSIGFEIQYEGSQSVTMSHDGITGKNIKMQLWRHPITLTAAGTNVRRRQCVTAPFYHDCNAWATDGSAFSETTTGELTAQKVLCVKCCSMH